MVIWKWDTEVSGEVCARDLGMSSVEVVMKVMGIDTISRAR